ncbi:MAG: hypothetical protein COB50_03030 [Thiotrichales bacterium]|nr:MAG: hypothetical protein COB50_03030 [Thiotrichales bacterium]
MYSWHDKNGNTYYADGPVNTETAVVQSFMANDVASNAIYGGVRAVLTADDDQNNNHANALGSITIKIISPKNNATIRNNRGNINVTVLPIPKLFARGGYLQLLMDGKLIKNSKSAVFFNLHDVHRGTHTLVVKALDKGHKVLATSDTITVHVHRGSILQRKKGLFLYGLSQYA